MPKLVSYEDRKINLPSWGIYKSQRGWIRAIAGKTCGNQSAHIQEAINAFIRTRG